MRNRARFRDLFRGPERAVLLRALSVFVLGIVIEVVAVVFGPEHLTTVAPILFTLLEHLGMAAIVASITIFLVDIGLRQEMLADIDEIVTRPRAAEFIRSFKPARKDYGEIIGADIGRAERDSHINMIGISMQVLCENWPGTRTLCRKVASGTHFRILILHPKSQLVDCIQNLSKDYGFPDLDASILHNIKGLLRQLIIDLIKLKINPANLKQFGSIEIRLYHDIISTMSYYASPSATIMGLYWAHTSGGLSPGFELSDASVIEDAGKHFDALWEHSAQYILAKVSRTEDINNISAFFPGPEL